MPTATDRLGEWRAEIPACPACGRPDDGNVIEESFTLPLPMRTDVIVACVVRCRACGCGYLVEVLTAAEVGQTPRRASGKTGVQPRPLPVRTAAARPPKGKRKARVG